MSPSSTPTANLKKYVLVWPSATTKEGQLHMAVNADKFQAARKLASDAHRANKKMAFDIVIKKKLSQEENAAAKARGWHKDDARYFSAYRVVIKKDSSSYKKAGKTLTSMFKPEIHSLRGDPAAHAKLVDAAMVAWKHMSKSDSP